MARSTEASTAEFLTAVRPLAERIGASLVDAVEVTDADIPLVWRGAVVAGVRFGEAAAEPRTDEGGLTGILADVETVASALGVSRFTVYNYLNRDRP
jgi:hypothetical protein